MNSATNCNPQSDNTDCSRLSEKDIDTPDLIVNFYHANPAAPKCISTITFGQMGFRLWDGENGRMKGRMHWDAVT